MIRKPVSTRLFTMPVLPAAASRTLRLIQHVRVEIPRIARTVEDDPLWAAEVERQAESPVWGLQGKPATLCDTIGQLGLRRFYQVAAVAAVGPLLRAAVPGYGLAAGELWDHSMAVALATREVLLEKGLKPCEEAFTAALLHDVGKLVLGSEPESGATGLDHAEAGAALLEHWKLPFWLIEAVRAHHAPSDGSFIIADLVRLAEELCPVSGTCGETPDRDLMSRWNLTRRSVARIQGRTRETLAGARMPRTAGEGR